MGYAKLSRKVRRTLIHSEGKMEFRNFIWLVNLSLQNVEA